MLRLTLLVSAIASGTFAATLAFAPAVLDVGQRVLAGETPSTSASVLSAETEPLRRCGPFAKIVDALRHGGECP